MVGASVFYLQKCRFSAESCLAVDDEGGSQEAQWENREGIKGAQGVRIGGGSRGAQGLRIR